MDVEKAIARVALEHDLPVDKVRAEMIDAIQTAKDNPYFKALFGEKEPSPEEVISLIAALLQ